ncbi:peroxiredoxin-5, mitochondrial [Euwallacea similis]|uniref:peroxiredoxin-5, mitochondrial n=1 Tax=Euwallacea similis TaxID=1736056 RepID=UPI00344B4153
MQVNKVVKFASKTLNSFNKHSLVFRRLLQTSSINMVKIGDQLPNVDLFENLPTNKVNIADLAKGKKIVLFAVPGAFTPGCSKTHLPGYVAKADDLKKQGISEIVCVSVNDPFVMGAWAKDQGTVGKIRLLADPSATLAKALDLTVDIAPLGGVRSKRYSMVVEDGKITSLQVEPDGTGLSCSLADKIKL